MGDATTFVSPIQRNKRGKPVGSKQRTLIINLYKKYMRCENRLKPKKMSVYHMISEDTGIGIRTIFETVKMYTESRVVKSPNKKRICTKTLFGNMDELMKNAIRAKVHAFFMNNEIPTLNKVHAAIAEDSDFPKNISRTSLFRILHNLNFKFEKRGRSSMLIDRDDIICWRRSYLRSIKRYREEGKKIYYLDETWVNSGHTTPTVWVDKTVQSSKQAFLRGLTVGLKNPSGKGKRLIIVHIGSDTGFVDGGLYIFEGKTTGDYHDEMTGEVFKEWFEGILSLLDPNSVIVLDNAPYHSVRLEKVPTTATRKQDIINWLHSKNIPTDDTMVKAELLHLVSLNKNEHQRYIIDELALQHNHIVLRSPPYHCELNPIELIWSQVKGYVARHNTTFKLDDVCQLLCDGISKITATDWANCVKHVVEKVETKFWKLDGLMDELTNEVIDTTVQPMIIEFGEDDDTDEFFEGEGL